MDFSTWFLVCLFTGALLVAGVLTWYLSSLAWTCLMSPRKDLGTMLIGLLFSLPGILAVAGSLGMMAVPLPAHFGESLSGANVVLAFVIRFSPQWVLFSACIAKPVSEHLSLLRSRNVKLARTLAF